MHPLDPETPTVPFITSPRTPTGFNLLMPSFRSLLFNLSTFASLIVTPIALLMVVAIFALVFRRLTDPLIALLVLIAIYTWLIIFPALLVTQLKSVKGTEINLGKALDQSLHLAARVTGLGILLLALFVAGLVLFIVPGVIFINRYFLAPYHLIDKDLTISAAMKASAKDSTGFAWKIWGIIGAAAFFCAFIVWPFYGWLLAIGLLILYSCAPAVCYENIHIARRLPHQYQRALKKSHPAEDD